MALDEQGKCPEALQYYNKSLEIKIRVHGQDHLSVAETKNNIASVQQGRNSIALQMWQQSLEIKIKILGLDHQRQPRLGKILRMFIASRESTRSIRSALALKSQDKLPEVLQS